jgi:hypothetical protein
MKTNKLIATALAASLAFAVTATPSMAATNTVVPVVPGHHLHGAGAVAVWGVIGCAGSIIVAAMQKNALGRGELTPQEAWSCGLLEYYNAATNQLMYVRR